MDLELNAENLQYDMQAAEEEQALFEENEEGEEHKIEGLEGEFGADRNDSRFDQHEADLIISGNAGMLAQNGQEEEYAEIDGTEQEDIFEQDNCKFFCQFLKQINATCARLNLNFDGFFKFLLSC